MDLNEISVFLKVIQCGSFSSAAKQLAMPVSTVSHKVSSLEKRLGVTLIQRTTRKLSITPLGQAYFKRCMEGLATIESAEDEVAAIQGEPNGLLRVTAPMELSLTIAQLIADYTARFPKVSVELLLTDRRVDLLSENVDLAIRAGELKDSTLIAKKLGSTWFGIYATAKYLKTKGRPSHPRELAKHSCLQFTPVGIESWKLVGPSGSLHAALPGRIILNDLAAVKELAVQGVGLAFLPNFYVQEELDGKKLERVLPEWRSNTNSVHFVYPAQRFVTPKLSAFIEMSTATLRGELE